MGQRIVRIAAGAVLTGGLCLFVAPGVVAGGPAYGQGSLKAEADPDSGLVRWHWQGQGLSLELAQLLPDQTRAFFMGRGFSAGQAEMVAEACVFQGIVRNTHAEEPIELDLARWRTRGRAGADRLRLNRDWQAIWEDLGVADSARIAFRWALFPTEHRFEPGDWLMGMVMVDRNPGDQFDLVLRWSAAGTDRRAVLSDLGCAGEGGGQ